MISWYHVSPPADWTCLDLFKPAANIVLDSVLFDIVSVRICLIWGLLHSFMTVKIYTYVTCHMTFVGVTTFVGAKTLIRVLQNLKFHTALSYGLCELFSLILVISD